MNEVYNWLKDWQEGGNWYIYSHAGVWHISLSPDISYSINDAGLRNQIKELLEAAERGSINE